MQLVNHRSKGYRPCRTPILFVVPHSVPPPRVSLSYSFIAVSRECKKRPGASFCCNFVKEWNKGANLKCPRWLKHHSVFTPGFAFVCRMRVSPRLLNICIGDSEDVSTLHKQTSWLHRIEAAPTSRARRSKHVLEAWNPASICCLSRRRCFTVTAVSALRGWQDLDHMSLMARPPHDHGGLVEWLPGLLLPARIQHGPGKAAQQTSINT